MNMRLKMGFAALLLTAGLASPVLGQTTDTQGATTTQTAPPKHYRAHATRSHTRTPTTGTTSTDHMANQLNAQSLAASQQGRENAPPAGR